MVLNSGGSRQQEALGGTMNQSDIAEGSAGTMAAIIQQIERGSMPMPQVSPLTRVAAKLRKNLELSSSEVLRIVEAAPEVAVQVIRLCNTAFYLRGRKPVADLPTGLVRLGNSTVATIIDTVAMRAFLKHESVAANILLRTMWHNSLYTSIGARMIAQQTGACDPNAALVFGLLHNIGEALLVKLLADRVPGAMNGLRPGSATHALIEEWHCFTGAVFLRKCNFPRPIVRLARCHHEPL